MSSPIAPIEERRLFGIGLVLAAYFLFVCLDGSAKWLGLVGIPALQVMFVRYAVHLGLAAAINLPSKGLSLLRTNSPGLELLRAGALVGSTLCNFTAVRYLPLTVTGAITFTVPLIVTALSVFILRETVGWRRWTAIAVGLFGVLIIVRPGTEVFHPATLLSLGGAVSYACYAMLTRRLAGVDSAGTQQFYGAALPTIVLAPFAIATWMWPTNALDWTVLALIGVIGFSGHQFITVAHRFAPASALAPFAYVQILFFTTISWLVFNQPPDIWLFIGAPIVMGSGLYIWLRERALARPASPITEER
ncbi:MAG: DMT family transporter [Devosia sp.]|jgi:drug/metabolite transporter (DMT)-like permease|nr:DMT family transporter [Alphaproteobacteria bacterium]MBU1563324.1 DMT family transporter [Alphaproteobacteria bacterium]MBU2302047.1 DMT family transporter [Alphaproteobacteria bacterium]MBU2367303.1 DMT family transporter [Alphaproteobacteria bacterium]